VEAQAVKLLLFLLRWRKRECKLLQWCLPGSGFSLYIAKEDEATAQLN
jgi:hypothetical protein